MRFSYFIGIILGLAMFVFALQNTSIATVRFLGGEFDISLALLIVLSAILGMALSMAISLPSVIRTAMKMNDMKKQNESFRNEAAHLS